MQQATREFAEDLDRVRGADDFKDDSLPLLISALQQGTALYGDAEMRRVVVPAEDVGEGEGAGKKGE